MTTESDESKQLERLLVLAADGIDGVTDQLIACAENRLYALARRMLRCYPRLRRWEQTDDIFQTAALRLHQSLRDVQPESVAQFMGLAATQIRRTLIDLVRHHFGPEGKHARHHSDANHINRDEAGQLLERQPTASSDEPETLEQWLRFHEGVEQLPVEERVVFETIWYSNFSQQQVAEMLDVSLSTVKRRMRSVRLKLGEILEGAEANQ